MRIRWVEVESLEEGMTRVGMRGLKGGWRGGMTVDVRLFFLPPLVTGRSETEKGSVKSWTRSVYRAVKFAVRPFESHPFSIATAPPSRSTSTLPPQTSSISNQDQGIELYIKSCGLGTWSNDLYLFAKSSSSSTASLASDKSRPTTKHVLALISGPYPGSGLPTFETKEVLEEKENLILIAGGSGMSFVIGVLDEVVGRRVRAGRGGDVKVVWVVKEQGKSRFSLEFRRFRSPTYLLCRPIVSSSYLMVPPSSQLGHLVHSRFFSPLNLARNPCNLFIFLLPFSSLPPPTSFSDDTAPTSTVSLATDELFNRQDSLALLVLLSDL